MYSVVLATMLAAGSTTPAWHHYHSCYSCYSCYSGYSCYGCHGCYGCYGCYGCHGCYGSYRVFPIFHRSYCHGCVSYDCCSCYSCSTYVYSGCCSCHVCSMPVVVHGCTGCGAPRVMPVPSGNGEVEALRMEVERLKKALEETKKKKSTDEEVSAPVSSRVTVTLPSDARLWVENTECPLTSSVRSFDTPPLNSNMKYFYNLKAEVVRDGRTVSQTQRVVITPGQEARVDFNSSGLIGTATR
jgi:uncharacterized protein (TIGR03000 family)